jgi:hypothetical protein
MKCDINDLSLKAFEEFVPVYPGLSYIGFLFNDKSFVINFSDHPFMIGPR